VLVQKDRLVRAVGVALGRDLHPARIRVNRTPAGRFNDSFFVAGDGLDVVVRVAPPDGTGLIFYERNMMAQEPEVHAVVRERTRVPVARILAHDTGRRVLDRDFLVMERLPGRPLSAVPLGAAFPDRVFRRVGEWLAEVHGITAGAYGYLGAHRPMPPAATWVEAFRSMWSRLLDDIEACSGYRAPEARRMRDRLDRHLSLFDRPVPASLLHMDVWHQNILVDERGEATGLLDWDRALWGDPEIEFAVLDYCGVSVPAFWEGYGRPRDTSPEARLRNLFYLLYEVQKYIVIERARRRNPSAADAYRRRSLALAERIP